MKKLISVILAVLLAFTSMAAGTAAFGAEAKAVEIEFSVYDGGVFTMSPELIDVSADEDNAYADAIGYNDNDSNVTVFDAIVAAHVAMFGEDFMDDTPMTYAGGMLKKSFGEETTALSYRVNGAIQAPDGSYYNLDSVLNDGDSVEYMFYQDAAYYGDKYTRFNERRIDVQAGKELTLRLSVETYDENWNTVNLPAAGFDIIVDGAEKIGTTDENGNITLRFDKVGTYGVYPEGVYSDDYDDYEIFAAYCTIEVENALFDYLEEQLDAEADYLYTKSEGYTIGDSIELVNLLYSERDTDIDLTNYASSVKEILDANDGKLISTFTEKEDLALYGSVITVLTELGYNTENFYGYNLDAAFNNADIAEARPHQYHYEYAIREASPARAKAIIDDMIANYYTLGKGYDNWGYSCDNTCHFLTAISAYAADYPEYVSDAKALIKTYIKDTGAYSDDMWVTEPNANSTALCVAAFASVGDLENAYNCYRLLVENYESANTGIFTLAGVENNYATKDAFYSLSYFAFAATDANLNEKEHIYKLKKTNAATCTVNGSKVYECVLCGLGRIQETETAAHTPVVDKAVAPTFKKAGKTEGSHCSVCGAVIVPQKTVKKLGSAKLSKVKKGKKSFTANWKKVNGVDGYQIQYSTKKSFKKKKTVTVKSAKTVKKRIKKLKSNKKYYVRIRAYKTINGKKQYSKWSAKKAVKTK